MAPESDFGARRLLEDRRVAFPKTAAFELSKLVKWRQLEEEIGPWASDHDLVKTKCCSEYPLAP